MRSPHFKQHTEKGIAMRVNDRWTPQKEAEGRLSLVSPSDKFQNRTL
jgi:hypothetical protein